MIYKNILMQSDFHLFHKNIWKYEYGKRNPIILRSNRELDTVEKLSDFLENNIQSDVNRFVVETDKVLLKVLAERVLKQLQANNITEYYNLGDFVFNISGQKIDTYMNVFEMGEYLDAYFNIFRDNGIKTTLILGNHDHNRDTSMSFFREYFDEVKDYVDLVDGDTKIILTHHPLYCSENPEKPGYSNQLDLEIVRKLEEENKEFKYDEVINFHGHTHQKTPIEASIHPEITYVNCCIEHLI